ncbi:MAG: Tryptophan/tyrosine permease family protein [Microgenomates bacterium OLB22]|nr:MAG: Tryptophan/tyrosine permease family protein [Microgenomates bacterium OLB22]
MPAFLSSLLFWEATATLVGSIIGAGILAIPAAVAQTGFFIGFWIILITGIISAVRHVMLAEVTLRTKHIHQLPGYVGIYLGKKAQWFTTLIYGMAHYGSLLAYCVGLGTILSSFFGGSVFLWGGVYYIALSLGAYHGISFVKRYELYLSSLVLILVVFIGFFAFDKLKFDHFVYMKPERWIVPYGVLLFAFSGAFAIPQMRETLRGHEMHFKPAVYVASIITCIVYLLFTVMTLGVTGQETTAVATIGLGQKIGPFMLILGNVLAFFTMSTSFMTVANGFVGMYEYDFGFSHRKAWLYALLPSLLLFAFGFRDFVLILSFVGGILTTLITVMIVMTFWKARHIGSRHPEFRLSDLHILGGGIIIFSLVGAVLTVLRNFS